MEVSMYKLFIAKWSNPCKRMLNTLKDFDNLHIVDIDVDPEEARTLGIKGVPCLVNTETGARIIGAVTLEQAAKVM
jgi:thioredoxin-like negative regulator of GroEL